MNIEVIDVTINDAQLLFEWANDSLTRQNSFNSDPIEWNNHVAWLNRMLVRSNTNIYLIHLHNEPVGVVRFDSDEDVIIGVTVAPNKRGKGLGAKIIKSACNRFWGNNNQNILACIKKDNVASRKVFEKAGFVFYKEQLNNNKACIILILKKDAN